MTLVKLDIMSFSDNQCRNLDCDPDKLISDLPAGMMLQLRDCLDNNPPTSNWRAFLSIISRKFNQYTFSLQEVESKFGCHIYNDSPSSKLFSELSGSGMTAAELVYALDQLKLEKILMKIKKYEPIDIIEQPAIKLRINEGELLQLEVKAIGFPYPRYQWFKEIGDDFEEVQHATDRVLRIEDTKYVVLSKFNERKEVQKSTDAGVYCCRLHNGDKDNQVDFSGYSTVIIDEAKKPELYNYKNGDEDSWTPSSNLEKDPPSDDLQFNPSKTLLPYITVQPRDNSVIAGEAVTLTCQACGQEPMMYKWYRNEQLVFQTPETFYKIQFATSSHAGTYKCIATNGLGSTHSNNVKLIVDAVVPVDMSPSATDKVALLIGNFDYRNESILKAPRHDVLKLAEIFRSLNFKVVSLLNLSKDEMILAVQEFVNLLGRGVYGVFYFCGHGFEEDGRCYLVPPDAPAGYTVDDCVCANDVQALIQRTDLALLCMILDICRIK
ncbi:hypothetical protein KUTeg_017951 [Tegillarca granosa]|uniref:Mucosa-associated lymphoid tissue lymphoma translocation protein 1 n=1 Tax=Tegillarca granosa TaxID=220873 RepID=A0ABQ9EGF8_TEGGR|nr:hypothetical protein KUTeg_017951 [Tegillarca granosa]